MNLLAEYPEVQTEARRKDLQQLIIEALQAEIPIQKFQQVLASDHLDGEFPRDFRENRPETCSIRSTAIAQLMHANLAACWTVLRKSTVYVAPRINSDGGGNCVQILHKQL
jgi:hypothetical protein